MQVFFGGKVPELDACTVFDINQFREVQPVRLRVVILSRVNDTPVVVLVDVGIQRDLLFCENRSNREIGQFKEDVR